MKRTRFTDEKIIGILAEHEVGVVPGGVV